MSELRTEDSFGQGGFLADRLRENPDYFEASAEERARVAGWLAGCPVVNELVAGRGAEAMAVRYEDINFWYSFIAREAADANPVLSAKLSRVLERLPEEPIGKHEPESVPTSYRDNIPPVASLAGFALPRMAIEYLGAEEIPGDPWPSHRIDSLIGMVRRTVQTADTPLDLVVGLGNEMAEDERVDRGKLIGYMTNEGWLDEHNAVSTMDSMKAKLEIGSGRLSEHYRAVN